MPQSEVAVCTIIAKNYLPYARCLMQSVKQFQPTYRRIVMLIDAPEGYFDPAAEDFDIITYPEIGIPVEARMPLKYTVMEFATAVKPFLLEKLFEKYSLDKLFYIDPDIMLFDSIAPLSDALDNNFIVLTPHLTGLLDDDKRPTELDIMMAGVYNLGFIGLSRNPQLGKFLKWWQGKLYNDCIVDFANNIFVDQRWIDLVPGLFDSVKIMRDPGFNVAYWNLHHRTIVENDGKFFVNGQPLRFFHYSGFNPENPTMLSKHETRYSDGAVEPAVRQLLEIYREKILGNGYSEARKWPYTYGKMANGLNLSDPVRRLFQQHPELNSGSDPFTLAGAKDMTDWLNRTEESPLITNMVKLVYDLRPDLQAAFPYPFGRDSLHLAHWYVENAVRDFKIDPHFISPVAERVAEYQGRQAGSISEQPTAAILSQADQFLIDWFNEAVEPDKAGKLVTVGLYAIYRSRPDVSAEFPDPFGEHRRYLAQWFVEYGPKEYGLHPVFLAPIRTALGMPPYAAEADNNAPLWDSRGGRFLLRWASEDLDVEHAAPIMLNRLAYRVYAARADVQAAYPDPLGRHLVSYAQWFLKQGFDEYGFDDKLAGRMRWEFDNFSVKTNRLANIERRASVQLQRVTKTVRGRLAGLLNHSPNRNLTYFQTAGTSLEKISRRSHQIKIERLGLNIVGYFHSAKGVGEAARLSLNAANAVSLPTKTITIELDDDSLSQDWQPAEDTPGLEAVNLFHINADQTLGVFNTLGPRFYRRRYNIGYWYWELNEFPAEWVGNFDYYDEIWVATEFVQKAIASRAPQDLPVKVVPPPVIMPPPASRSRADFCLPTDKFIYLNMFDQASTVGRKNPFGLITAFRLACEPGEHSLKDVAHLVIKVRLNPNMPAIVPELKAACEGLPVTILTEDMPGAYIPALINCADCVVSLHRSEGLGLTPAQAMLLGKPTIATNYSGNVDFMRPDNSYLVDYKMVTLEQDYFPYRKGMQWADPDLEQAAQLMQSVYFDPVTRECKVAAAREFMQSHYSPAASGTAIKNRLAEIQKKVHSA